MHKKKYSFGISLKTSAFSRVNSSKSLFKEKVHAILLKIFEAQDSYADLNTIISDFKKY